MEWHDMKEDIRADLLARGLKEPRRRLTSLDSLEQLLGEVWPGFLTDPAILQEIGKQAVSKELARLKKTGKLNGAEESVLNQIFERLAQMSMNSLAYRHSGELHSKSAVFQPPLTSSPGCGMTNIKLGLPPVIREGSTILIVGTLPGDDSIQLGRYYANVSNHFWKILSAVYGETIEDDYLRRLEFLHSKGLALWDVLKNAERPGSSDSGIENEVCNDFPALLTAFPGLRAIVFNGGEARRLFRRHVKKSRRDAVRILLNEITLPSTSSAPGAHVLSFEDKVARWQALRTL